MIMFDLPVAVKGKFIEALKKAEEEGSGG